MSARLGYRDIVAHPDRFRVLGLDLSLTSTGMSDGTWSRVVQTTPADRLEVRLHEIISEIGRFADAGVPVRLAVIEGPAWSKVSGVGHEELSALRVMVRHRLWRLNIPYAMVPPTTLKLWTSGNGRATKPEMVAAVADRFGHDLTGIKVKDGRYDLADATALAAMGLARVGRPMGEAANPASLDAVNWPDLLSD